MQVLIVIDAQNEFSPTGKRPVPHHSDVLEAICRRVEQARHENRPIAWVRHHNQPTESPAFMPGTWGAEFSPGCGPKAGSAIEKEFLKNVYGALMGSTIGAWLKPVGADEVLILGFYTHGCVSTTAREAIMSGLTVFLDRSGTGSCEMVFFFQAEDGIRDDLVTGVQTCALPI